MRLSNGRVPVVGLRANIDLLFVDLGVRAVTSLEHDPEAVLWGTLGLGQC